MPSIKYYYAPGSCALAPHILLREIGAEFDGVNIVDPRIKFLPEEFRRINPKMRVPVLSIDENTITEVPAISTMIASLAPERNLLGRTTLETVRVHEWMGWLAGTVHSLGFKLVFKPLNFTTDPAGGDAIAAKARQYVVELLDLLEAKLDGVYAVGGAFTIVDPYLIVFYRWGNSIGLNMKETYPKFAALVTNLVEQHPSVNRTLEVEGIDSTL